MDQKIKAILCMLLSAMGFSVMQILIAMTAGRIPVFEQMLFRNLVTTFIAYFSLKRRDVGLFGKRENRPLLLLRSTAGFLGMFCLFYAADYGNQGDVAVLTKLSPFIVILLAAVFLRERPKAFQLAALVIATGGAVVTANPAGAGGVSTASLVALLSSVFAGLAYFCVGKLKGREDPKVIVFVFSLFTTVMTGLLSIPQFVLPRGWDILLLLGIGCMAAVGQLGLTYAYSMAKASEVSVFSYGGIPLTMVLGSVVLHQEIRPTTLVGSLMVIASGIVAFVGENRHKGEA